MYFVRSTFCLNLVTWKLLQLTYDYWSVIFDTNDISFVSLLLFFIYWSFTNCYGYFRRLDFALHLFFVFWNYYIFNNGDFYFICIFYLPKHLQILQNAFIFLAITALQGKCQKNENKIYFRKQKTVEHHHFILIPFSQYPPVPNFGHPPLDHLPSIASYLTFSTYPLLPDSLYLFLNWFYILSFSCLIIFNYFLLAYYIF